MRYVYSTPGLDSSSCGFLRRRLCAAVVCCCFPKTNICAAVVSSSDDGTRNGFCIWLTFTRLPRNYPMMASVRGVGGRRGTVPIGSCVIYYRGLEELRKCMMPAWEQVRSVARCAADSQLLFNASASTLVVDNGVYPRGRKPFLWAEWIVL